MTNPEFGENEQIPTGNPQIPFEVHERTLIDVIFLNRKGLRAGWRAGVYVAICFAFLFIFQAALVLLRRAFSIGEGTQLTPGRLIAQEIVLAACAICAALVMTRIENRPFRDYGMPLEGAFSKNFWQGALWGIAHISAVMLLMYALGGYTFGAPAIHGAALIRYAVLWSLFFVIVGIAEEFLFRGYLQSTLASGIGFWPAAILLSLVFGRVHLQNPGESVLGAVSVFGIGMLFSLTLRRTGTLWFAIGMHAAFDFGETYIFSVPDSGIVMPGQLLASSLHGSRWLTGGSVGPEASLLSFIVLALVFALFDRVYRPQNVRDDRSDDRAGEESRGGT
jgi:membrane protease YdiL (CAAX protease family)